MSILTWPLTLITIPHFIYTVVYQYSKEKVFYTRVHIPYFLFIWGSFFKCMQCHAIYSIAVSEYERARASWILGSLFIAYGQRLNYLVYKKLGIIGVYYGNLLGYNLRWVKTFPFDQFKNPQYTGAIISLLGIFSIIPTWNILIICSYWSILYLWLGYIEGR